jgi:5,10-methylene-tetrahydrofolate dehydrogenase/methenyl tetrahydrofolate cyclohydrolase
LARKFAAQTHQIVHLLSALKDKYGTLTCLPGASGQRSCRASVEVSGFPSRPNAITPVPGGVGPMTIAMLMQNTLRARF